MPWNIVIAIGLLAAEWVINYYNAPSPPPPEKEVSIPITSDGSTVPMIYGRCRVNQAILAYTSQPISRFLVDINSYQYMLDMLLVLGIPIQFGATKIYMAWSGDSRFVPLGIAQHRGSNLIDQDGDGNFEGGLPAFGHRHLPANIGLNQNTIHYWTTAGTVEFLNGNPSMQLVDPTTGQPATQAGLMMTSTAWLGGSTVDAATRAVEPWNYGFGHVNPFQVPSYRNFMSVWLWDFSSETHWGVGTSPQVSALSFEVSSYAPIGGDFSVAIVGVDCNPVSVIYDLITGSFGKLGLPTSVIDQISFLQAAQTLAAEQHGFSRAFESRTTASEMLQEICVQIDAVLYEDSASGKIKLKMIRADYDTATLPIVNPDNCEELQNFAAGGWTDVVNRVVLTFTDRTADYKPGTAIAFSQANAVGQDGKINEMAISCPGITTQTLANQVAQRILAASSRPLIKCRALVNRSFLRMAPGDVLKLSWPEVNVSNTVMRVVAVNRGTLENGAITLDLVQDTFYTHRNLPPVPTGIDIRSLVTRF